MNSKKTDPAPFWKWFEANEKLIRDVLDDEYHPMRADVVENLNNFILDFGVFTWEVGEGKSKPYYFIISPNCNAELLPLSRHIISAAPQLREWEFHAAKQPKDWDLCFRMYDEYMEERDIDASQWTFLLAPSKGKVKIVLFPEKPLGIDDDTLQRAAEIVVVSLIGEEGRIRNVDTISFSNSAPPTGATEIDSLRSAIESML